MGANPVKSRNIELFPKKLWIHNSAVGRRLQASTANGQLPVAEGRQELAPGESLFATFNGNIHLDLTGEIVFKSVVNVVRLGYFNGSQWIDVSSIFIPRYVDLGPKTPDNNNINVNISGPTFNQSKNTESYTHGWIFATIFTTAS